VFRCRVPDTPGAWVWVPSFLRPAYCLHYLRKRQCEKLRLHWATPSIGTIRPHVLVCHLDVARVVCTHALFAVSSMILPSLTSRSMHSSTPAPSISCMLNWWRVLNYLIACARAFFGELSLHEANECFAGTWSITCSPQFTHSGSKTPPNSRWCLSDLNCCPLHCHRHSVIHSFICINFDPLVDSVPQFIGCSSLYDNNLTSIDDSAFQGIRALHFLFEHSDIFWYNVNASALYLIITHICRSVLMWHGHSLFIAALSEAIQWVVAAAVFVLLLLLYSRWAQESWR